MKNIDPARALAVTAALVIIALTGAAFWLSYAHLAEVAAAHGLGRSPARSWAWPATLDLFIVAGELLMLRAALARRVDWWAIGLTVAGSGGSIALNVAGVGSAADPLDYVVAAVPPTAALLAFGALMRQVHQALAGHAAVPLSVPEVTEVVTIERADDDHREVPVASPPALPAVVIPAVTPPTYKTDGFKEQRLPGVTVREPERMWTPDRLDRRYAPAEAPRKVVTEVVALTPAELRRRARKLDAQVVADGGRGVTIDRLREEFGISRREATELRREVVGGRS